MREYPVTQDTAAVFEKFVRSREPELLVFDCAPEANVYPMVPAGAALSEMLFEED
jgi:thiamine pyrophosphate-dependent acetolactate synthase large subunit-like protein